MLCPIGISKEVFSICARGGPDSYHLKKSECLLQPRSVGQKACYTHFRSKNLCTSNYVFSPVPSPIERSTYLQIKTGKSSNEKHTASWALCPLASPEPRMMAVVIVCVPQQKLHIIFLYPSFALNEPQGLLVEP